MFRFQLSSYLCAKSTNRVPANALRIHMSGTTDCLANRPTISNSQYPQCALSVLMLNVFFCKICELLASTLMDLEEMADENEILRREIHILPLAAASPSHHVFIVAAPVFLCHAAQA